jgi:DNA-binding NarL/FixJ family response regulator
MTRVLIATSEPILAKGLETVLMAGGMQIVAVCHDVFELFESLLRCHPDIAVLDMALLPAPEAMHDLRRLAPRCRLVPWPRLALSDSPASLGDALNVMALFPEPDPSPSVLVNLTCNQREREFITLVGYGLSDEQIAVALGRSRSAVQKLLRSLSDRLGVEDRYELVLYGLSTLGEADQTERSV